MVQVIPINYLNRAAFEVKKKLQMSHVDRGQRCYSLAETVNILNEGINGEADWLWSPVRVVSVKERALDRFSYLDSVALEAMALYLNDHLPHSWLNCWHKGHGGVVRAKLKVSKAMMGGEMQHWWKATVSDFYASVPHYSLLSKLEPYLNKGQYRFVYRALKNFYGPYWSEKAVGVPRGGALSATLVNFYLHECDEWFERKSDYLYVRYMDDIVIGARTKLPLRRGVKEVERLIQDELGLSLSCPSRGGKQLCFANFGMNFK